MTKTNREETKFIHFINLKKKKKTEGWLFLLCTVRMFLKFLYKTKCMFYLKLTQFPLIAIFHGQYNEPRSGEDELRQQEARYFGADVGSVGASWG